MRSRAVVLVEVEDEDDATVIFQTMNSRGKDLETADLIKSHIFGELKANNASFDAARDKGTASSSCSTRAPLT
jgi:uncharacterized protein with ParB-like and HNH nuclease domain